MIENVSTQLTVFHCFAHCLLPGRAFASLYVLLFLEKEAEIGGRDCQTNKNSCSNLEIHMLFEHGFTLKNLYQCFTIVFSVVVDSVSPALVFYWQVSLPGVQDYLRSRTHA